MINDEETVSIFGGISEFPLQSPDIMINKLKSQLFIKLTWHSERDNQFG